MELTVERKNHIFKSDEKKRKAVFLDRDGVINVDKHFVHKIEDFELKRGIVELLQYLTTQNYKLFVVTNQSGIGRGLYKEEDFQIVNEWMLGKFEQQGVSILDVFFCPHGPDDNCYCRKPKPGLFIDAKEKYDIDMNKSWMIGDKEADIEAANNAGISQTILVRSGHIINEDATKSKYILDSIIDIADVIS